MPEFPVSRPTARAPTHPGELFREILEDHLHLSISAAAAHFLRLRATLFP